MKKILFILFTVQSVLAPHITKSYSVNSIEDSYEYSIVNQEKKTAASKSDAAVFKFSLKKN